jgi:predicted DNA-binding transcriptional regulator YafY
VRADRLLAILLLLQARGRVSARELAAELEVSERTIYRDVEALSTAGVPVYAERGRHGGCALLPGYRTDVSGLTPDEARALFMFGGRGAPAGAEGDLRQALRKLLSALPAPARPAALAARERVVVDAAGWHQAEDDVPHLATVQEAVWQGRRLRLRYRGADDTDGRPVTVDPYGLLVKTGRWYLLGSVAGADRVFRLSRVDDAALLDEPAPRPAGLDLDALWERLRRQFEDRGTGVDVTLRARAAPAPRLLRLAARQLSEPAPDPLPAPDRDGWVTLRLRFVALGAARALLAGFGGDVEVLAPDALRGALVDLAHEILARYDGGRGAQESGREPEHRDRTEEQST